MSTRRFAVVLIAFAIVVGGCSRGPVPPRPTEDYRPTVIGPVSSINIRVPMILLNDARFEPPTGSTVRRITNWPGTSEPDEYASNLLFLAGPARDGSWWYELAGYSGPNADGCWEISGGSFDEGDSIRLSSGLRLLKAPTFEIRDEGHSDVDWFPGRQNDQICVDVQGRALYFIAFIGR